MDVVACRLHSFFSGNYKIKLVLRRRHTPNSASVQENANKLYVKKPYPTLAGIKTILDSLPRNEKAKGAKPEQFVDLSIVRELDELGVHR